MNNQKLILGTVQFGLPYGISNTTGQVHRDNVFEILDYAHEVGIDTLDTARSYGSAESVIGEYLSQVGNKFEVITKLAAREIIENNSSIEASFEQLLVDHLYALLFHSFGDFQKNKEYLATLIRLKEEKVIDHIGVSVYTNAEIEALLKYPEVEVIQLPFNLLDNDYQRGVLLSKAKAAGKIIHTRSVFLQGLFFKHIIPSSLSSLEPYLAIIKTIAKKGNQNIAALALQYVMKKPYIDGVLIGIDSLDQLKANIASINAIIPQELFEEIDKIAVSNTTLLNPANWKL